MKTMRAELFCKRNDLLGEGPVWWEDTLYWVDIEGRKVHALPVGADQPRSWDVGERVGCVVPWQGRGLLVALQSGLAELDPLTGALAHLIDPEPDLPDNRLNDGKCDPQGRFVVGSMPCGESGTGSVYRISHDLDCARVHGPVGLSNGLAWSADGATLYYIDTPTRRVDAFAYDAATGNWADPRPVIRIPEGSGSPDGMTIDAEGNLWIALWEGWAVECWNPRTGEQLARIEVPAARVTCPTFGGHDLDTLYITTASAWLSSGERAQQPLAGSLFSARPGVTGMPAQPFLGQQRTQDA